MTAQLDKPPNRISEHWEVLSTDAHLPGKIVATTVSPEYAWSSSKKQPWKASPSACWNGIYEANWRSCVVCGAVPRRTIGRADACIQRGICATREWSLSRRKLAHSVALPPPSLPHVASGLDLQEAFTLAVDRVAAMCAEASRIVSVCAREAAAGWASCHLRFTANFGLQRKPWGVDHIGTALPEIEFDVRSSDQIPATWAPVTVSVTTPCPHKLLGHIQTLEAQFSVRVARRGGHSASNPRPHGQAGQTPPPSLSSPPPDSAPTPPQHHGDTPRVCLRDVDIVVLGSLERKEVSSPEWCAEFGLPNSCLTASESSTKSCK